MKTLLLSDGATNAKTAKNQGIAKSYILYLAPGKQNSFGKNVCGKASPGCLASCLFTSGRGKFSNVKSARIRRTDLFFSDPIGFLTQVYKDLYLINAEAYLENKATHVRLNGTSDLDFIELIKIKLGKDVLKEFTNIVFYDYTKNLQRAAKYLGSAYKLTFSRSETNQAEVETYLKLGGSVAVVFKTLPAEYLGFKVIDGTASDLRAFDPENIICGLTAKGDAKKDTSGFVI